MKHSGFLFKLRPTDFVTGSSPLVIPEVNLTADWTPYQPTFEKQYKDATFDTMSCTTFSALNVIETWVNWHKEKGNFTQKQLEKLFSLGFYSNGKFNCSDRFTAIMSNTMPNGNYMQLVLDSIRRDGLLPETVFPFGGNTWDEYHNKTLITDEMKQTAKEILNILNVSYEWIIDTATVPVDLKQCPIQGAIPETANHAIEVIAPGIMFNTYEPYLSPVPFVRYAMKVIVKVKPEIVPTEPTLRKGAKGEAVKKLQTLLNLNGAKLIVDGDFGFKTLQVLISFQKSHELVADGICGPRTWTELKKKQ